MRRTGFILALPIMVASEHHLTMTYTGPDGIPKKMRTYSAPPPPLAQRVQGDVDDILNTAQSAWDFVKDNQPVVNLQAKNYARAVPKGYDWSQLTFEKSPHLEPKGKSSDYPDGSHHLKWFGNTNKLVCELEFRNHWYAKGHRNGHSNEQYIDQATQIVSKAHAGLTNKLEASCSVSGPTNVGKDGKILAELTLQVSYHCSGVHGYQTFIVRGDGTFKNLSDEFLDDDAVAV